MSNSADSEALTAWADALRNGLGRVRFGDLPDEEFERILEAVPADDVDTLVVFAENASMSGLASIESAGPLVPRVRRAIAARRAELEPTASGSVVAFPTLATASTAAPTTSQPPRRTWLQRLVTLFAEPATGFDEIPGEPEESALKRPVETSVR